jgi:hypothetical protein
MTTAPPKPGRWRVGDTGNRSSEIVRDQLDALALMSRRAQAAHRGSCGLFSVESDCPFPPQSAAKATTKSAKEKLISSKTKLTDLATDPSIPSEEEITDLAKSYVSKKNTKMMKAFIEENTKCDIGEVKPFRVSITFDLHDTKTFNYGAFNDVSKLLNFSRPAPRAHIFQRRFVHFSDAILAIRLLTAIVSAALCKSGGQVQLMFLYATLECETNEKDLERDMREVTVTEADATEKKGSTKRVVALKGE